MGVVIKQSFWGSAFAYTGVILGFVNNIILRPAYLEMSEIGLISLVISNALMFAPFVSMGMPMTFLRYFPYLQEDQSLATKFYSFQLIVILLANILLAGIVWLSLDWIEAFFLDESPIYNQYILISILIMIFHSFFLHLHAFSRVKLDVIVPNALKEVQLRIGNIVLILLYAFEVINFDLTVRLLTINYGLALLLQLFFLYKKYQLTITWQVFDIPKDWIRKMFNFGGYNLLLAGSNSIYSNISFLLIPAMLGTGANGIYTTCFYIGIIIEMPKRSMVQVISPMLSSNFKNQNLGGINDLYKKASQTLSVIALLFFIGVICNLDDLFLLIPQGSQLSLGYYVVVAIALAKVIDLAFSFNSEILIYSAHYRYNLYFFLATAALMFALNVWWIDLYGINGAALAFFVSTVFYNGIKYLFIKRKLALSPFTQKHYLLLLASAAIALTFWFLPIGLAPVFNIVIRSILITIIYVTAIYLLKISEDINRLVRLIFDKYLNIKL